MLSWSTKCNCERHFALDSLITDYEMADSRERQRYLNSTFKIDF